MTDLQSLIERLEKAEGPDREIDAQIASVSGWRRAQNHSGWLWIGPHGITRKEPPRFTESLDAAVGVVPEGWHPGLDPIFFDEEGDIKWDAILCKADWSRWNPVNSDWIKRIEARGKTPPNALSAAALKARASEES